MMLLSLPTLWFKEIGVDNNLIMIGTFKLFKYRRIVVGKIIRNVFRLLKIIRRYIEKTVIWNLTNYDEAENSNSINQVT